MMGIVVPETCWAYKKCNKIVTSSWFLFFSYHNDARYNKHQKLNYLSVFVNFNSVISRSFEKTSGIYDESKLMLLVHGIYV